MTDNIPLAVAYYLNGVNFRVCAERLKVGLDLDGQGRPAKLTAIPLFFLASHAAELFLKAALLKRGTVAADLKKIDYRHNLSALLGLLQNIGVSVSSATAAVVKGLSQQHADHSLRYTVLADDGKFTYWPPIAHVFTALDELLLITKIGKNETEVLM